MSDMYTKKIDLRGIAVVVTGSGRGIGRGHALALAGAGADVVVNDIDRDVAEAVVVEIRNAGGSAVASAHSVSEPSECQALIDSCVTAFGRIDGLVNNAGLEQTVNAIDEDPERQRRLITVNVLGAMWCGAAALRHMIPQGAGSIVNTVSGAASGVPGLSTYGTSKSALFGLTYAWAQEVAGTGVRVNAISPVAATRMSRPNTQDAPAESIAPLVTWLMHSGAADVTGQVIRFDGTALGLVSPPRIVKPMIRRATWSAETVGAAFDDDLKGRLQAFGFGVLLEDAVV